MRSEHPLNQAEEVGVKTCVAEVQQAEIALELVKEKMRSIMTGLVVSRGIDPTTVASVGTSEGGKNLIVIQTTATEAPE